MPFLLPPAQVPPNVVLKPILEIRERFERRIDRDFNADTRDNRSDLLSRYRVGIGFSGRGLKGELIYQYAHDEAWQRSGNLALWRSDVVLANVEVPISGGRLTLGRQRIRVGSDRLLGTLEWNNVSNAWDGLQFTNGKLGLFGAKTGVNPFPNDEVGIVGATYAAGPLQTLLVYKHDARGAGIDEATLSEQVRLKLGKLSLDAEGAVQFGHRGSRRK